MSAYLNRAPLFSMYPISRKAEDALLTGLRIARNKGNERVQSAFHNNMSIVYAIHGKLEEGIRVPPRSTGSLQED